MVIGSSVEDQAFGLDGKARLLTLRRGNIELRVTNVGATIISLIVPDKLGQLDDIVLGFDTVDPYTDGRSRYFGSIVGRVANRIAGASFVLDGQKYNLFTTKTNPDITLHGGKIGFDKVLWDVVEVKHSPDPSVTLVYKSFDGEEGFPGNVEVTVKYTLTGEAELRTNMTAVPDKATPISLAQHTYWNLAGHSSGDILGHSIRISADHITPVNESLITTGEYQPVKGTAFDFTEYHTVGERIADVPGGYDHNYVLLSNNKTEGDLHFAASLKDPKSGRVMDLFTDAPGMQFYTGNFLLEMDGKAGAKYNKHSGLCLETQGFPNAVNQPKFPSIIYRPGEVYKHTMVHKFYTEKDQ